MTSLAFEAAVPKYLQLQLQPASGNVVATGQVPQKMISSKCRKCVSSEVPFLKIGVGLWQRTVQRRDPLPGLQKGFNVTDVVSG